ncbi:DUF4166 domain-containing protein [Pseudoxanthomonas sp.]|uniref:DUF4166 domain-containing protein n=1 Tax=Pseudoxanthomonas sp. TaxID=1871049 RepID=UPI00260A9642|nr:DUF4166 domain-containing protein [Pseudoxanthomonas sp.]WDS37613.1 MAG: DUF4166 domain-containing protein [Pseudoxanthomonas sp.]
MDASHFNLTAVPEVAVPLFKRVLGDVAFDALPEPVQALHASADQQCWRGQGTVLRGHHPLARLMAWATRLPPAGAVPVAVTFGRQQDREHWRRTFGRHVMASTLWQQGDLLCERLGLVTFGFALVQQGQALAWQVRRVRVLGLPLPARWFAGAQARESAEGGRYTFAVDVALPWIGLLIRYTGWLCPAASDE